MKLATSLALTLPLFASSAYGHYIFQILGIDGTQYDVYQYIRENTNQNSPVTDLTSPDLRCNVGADDSTTDTVDVPSGADFTFTADIAVYHQGPLCFYMAQAPSTASEYDGSGQSWFKIKEIGPTFEGDSATWDLEETYGGTLPASLPDGEYLLRVEQLAIHNPGATPQFFISCAQIRISGGGSGEPSPLVEIPGHISADDPGYTANIYDNFTNYTVPGPAVWAG